ncbi:MAG: hypothetical protein ACK4ON_05255 [Bacteroidia bacterium]
MKKSFIILSITASVIMACNKKETNINTVSQGLIYQHLSNLGENNHFPFQIISNENLPKLTNAGEVYVLSNTFVNNEAYFYEMSKHRVQKVNLSNGQVTGSISYTNLPENTDFKFTYLDDDFNVWYMDTLLYVFNSSGQYLKTIHLPLHHQGKDYIINTNDKTSLQYFKNNATLIIPLNCISEYEASEAHLIPQFASYNLNSGEIAYLAVYMPENYPADTYLGELSSPYTAVDGDVFYAIFPLSNKLYAYNISLNNLQVIPLQFPVALSNPAMLNEPQSIQQMAEIKYFSNHIAGLAVADGKIFIQQTDTWDNHLSSKKYADNTILYSFSDQGQLTWQGAFPQNVFDDIGVFTLHSAQNGKLFFTSFNQNNDKKLIQILAQL